MALLFLIRHGLTDQTGKRLYGWTPGVHLSERGLAQADDLARRMADVRVAAVYSSPLERCRETAAPLASAAGVRVLVRRDLGEVDYGDWTGRPLAQLSRTKLWRSVQQTPSQVTFPAGESFLHVQERALRVVYDIASEHPRGRVALVSHGDVVRLLISHLSGAHLDEFQRIVIDTASVSVVALARGAGPPRILLVNDTGSLDGFAGRRPIRRK
jgi:probable phosphomutase (TIGR03848 family)